MYVSVHVRYRVGLSGRAIYHTTTKPFHSVYFNPASAELLPFLRFRMIPSLPPFASRRRFDYFFSPFRAISQQCLGYHRHNNLILVRCDKHAPPLPPLPYLLCPCHPSFPWFPSPASPTTLRHCVNTLPIPGSAVRHRLGIPHPRETDRQADRWCGGANSVWMCVPPSR